MMNSWDLTEMQPANNGYLGISWQDVMHEVVRLMGFSTKRFLKRANRFDDCRFRPA